MRRNLSFPVCLALLALAFMYKIDRAESLDINTIASGSVVQISPHSIIILDDLGHDVEFQADARTVYDNIQKMADLKAGDKVQIEYHEYPQKNMASAIKKMELES